jgi:hypothetical protein
MAATTDGPVEHARRAFEKELREATTAAAALDRLEAASERLRLRLTPIVGARGYEPLLRRALHLAAKEHPVLAIDRGHAASASPFVALRARLQSEDPKTVHRASVAVIIAVLTLWAGFVGEELTEGVVRDVWPESAPAGSRSRKGGRR